MWLSFSLRKQPHPPGPQGSPEGTCPHRTPEHSGCPATGSPHQVNKYPCALPPSLPLVPPGPGNTYTHQFGQRKSHVIQIRNASGFSWLVDSKTIGCQVYRMLVQGTQSLPIRTSLSHLVSNEELVIDSEGHGVAGTEPPHRPVDGVSRQPPLLCILFYEWDHIPLVLCYVGPSQI